MERLKNGHLISHLGQVSCTGKPCRAGTDDSHLHAVGLIRLCRYKSMLPGPVSHKTLQLSDGNRLSLDAADTFSFTLALLGAHTSAHSWKGAGLCYGIGCILEFSFLYF